MFHDTIYDNKKGAPELNKITAADYAEYPEENLADLHQLLRSGCYRAPPIKLVVNPFSSARICPSCRSGGPDIGSSQKCRKGTTHMLARGVDRGRRILPGCTGCMPFLKFITPTSSFLIYNLHIIGSIVFATKINAPLPIYPNAVLPCPLTR